MSTQVILLIMAIAVACLLKDTKVMDWWLIHCKLHGVYSASAAHSGHNSSPYTMHIWHWTSSVILAYNTVYLYVQKPWPVPVTDTQQNSQTHYQFGFVTVILSYSANYLLIAHSLWHMPTNQLCTHMYAGTQIMSTGYIKLIFQAASLTVTESEISHKISIGSDWKFWPYSMSVHRLIYKHFL